MWSLRRQHLELLVIKLISRLAVTILHWSQHHPPAILSCRANNPKGLLEVREALEKVHKVEDLLPIMKVSLSSEHRRKANSTFFEKELIKCLFINVKIHEA
jgi:hypothetical protein